MKYIAIMTAFLTISTSFAQGPSCNDFNELMKNKNYSNRFMQSARTVIVQNREASNFYAFTGGETYDSVPLDLKSLSLIKCHEYKSPSQYVVEFQLKGYNSFCHYTPQYIRSPFSVRCGKRNDRYGMFR